MRLFKSGGDGKADSLSGERFAKKGHAGYDEVPAVRLSDALEKYAAPGEPVLLRMNIEGAEQYVIDDLVAANAVDRVAGYFGMWDDLSKIDPSRDAGFRSTMRLVAQRLKGAVVVTALESRCSKRGRWAFAGGWASDTRQFRQRRRARACASLAYTPLRSLARIAQSCTRRPAVGERTGAPTGQARTRIVICSGGLKRRSGSYDAAWAAHRITG